MEAIIRDSPIPLNGPIYSPNGNNPYPVRVYCTCFGKGSKAKSTAPHVEPTHRGPGGFFLPVLAPRNEHLRFPICTHKKKGPIAMGAAHNELQWGKLLRTHLWINHLYFFLQRCGEFCQSSPALPWRRVTGGGSACCAIAGA